ncbi:MAG: selenocysteine-specific translation elongation factor [Verrucomicrobiales bacterium]|nr:selenocysteine-specific translation elongation factor [Verrucomicrobiales bacterium]
MPETRHFILGTAGHIDHGKSSLVKALTGTDPDRLPEEKARGMTIELGFANLELPAADESGDTLNLGIVDVPGHADFVKNMVAGVGSIDIAVFIVAADDGWMPQTEEHYQILNYLKVPNAIVALTKVDLVEDLDLVLMDLEENLAGGPWENIEIVPTSSHTGQGIDELRAKISETLTASPAARDCEKPRLPVDRAFSIKGVGTVVTGTLIDGRISSGADLVAQPTGLKTHIRNVQSHKNDEDTVYPGTRTALNLTGISVAARGVEGIARGNVITDPKLGGAVTAIDVLLEKSDREVRGQRNSLRPVKSGREVLFHYGSASYPARMHILGGKETLLEPGESVLAELRFREPVYVFVGDRFVLRNASAGTTLAGGVVLDEDANRRAFRKLFQEKFLAARREHFDDLETLITSQMVRDKARLADELLAKTRFSAEEIADKVEELIAAEKLARSGTWLFDSAWWGEISASSGEKINAFHRENPDLPGMPLKELEPLVEPELPFPRLFDTILAGLIASDFAQAGPAIRSRAHIPELPPDLVDAGNRIRKILADDPLGPPNRGEVAPGDADRKALRFLINVGEVVELDQKTVISTEGFESIKKSVTDFLKANQPATASDLKDAAGTSRRFMMPILERFDEDGLTERDGDFRTLK